MAKKKVKTTQSRPLVLIEWLDHTSHDGWMEEKEIVKTLDAGVMRSVGWLITENERAYYISGTLSPLDAGLGDSRCIVKGAVVKCKKLSYE